MSDSAPKPAAAGVTPRRRWWQFRLSNLIILFVALSVVVSIYLNTREHIDELQTRYEYGLNLEGDNAEFWIVQRQHLSVPGSNGKLELRIGDITGGEVPVTLREGKKPCQVDARPMRKGDTVQFRFRDLTYDLALVRFDLHLFHDDRAFFRITPSDELPLAKQIEQLITRIEEAGVVFIRNDQEHSAEDAAAHLRRKYSHAGDKIESMDQFIDKLASKSSVSGRDYEVLLEDGRKIKAADWLRQLLAGDE